ncbi:MAG TPA: sigma 54-interacting transcriptional regulator [Enhygromyxa sp.]|nr:sigma 54-interacting transcriptional regulator [Enhygromyxa sp.]
MVAKDTVEDPSEQTVLNPSRSTERRAAQPGITIVSCGGAPCFEVIPLSRGALELGRDALADRHLDDERMSRRHLSVALERSTWTVTDLGSTNGTRVDAVALERPWSGPCPRVIRAGQTLMVPVADVSSHVVHGIDTSTETIVGPQLRAAHERILAIARSGQNLLISGPSGSGKEIAAGLFHRAWQPSRGSAERPFVALNCATIPAGLAERILFGTRRGAYSGAVSDAVGLMQAADGGTLFLDEIGELPLDVQAKLLRVIETKQVLPIGALEPVPVEFRVCAATLADLRSEVVKGRFREDLYFRIARPEVSLPALAARPEEIPWLIQRALAEVGRELIADVELVEQCLLRPWPGNVRELLTELRCAAGLASDDGVVGVDQLSARAGLSLRAAPGRAASVVDPVDPIEDALRAADGNVSRAAKQLGISRSKVRRFVEKAGIDLDALRRG